MNIDELVHLSKQHNIDAVHPGYGFLSESADFAKRMQDAGIDVIGPGSLILDRTGDKLQARKLAEECSNEETTSIHNLSLTFHRQCARAASNDYAN